jgi:hypothetical protein
VQPFDLEQLTPASRAFAERLLSRFPEFEQHCTAHETPGRSGRDLEVRVPSPLGRQRDVVFWMDEGLEPSMAFGNRHWHTHESCAVFEGMLDLFAAILADEFVLFEEFESGLSGVLDLRREDELLDYWSDPESRLPAVVKSFHGVADRRVLADRPVRQGARVACPRCEQDWLQLVQLAGQSEESVLCPECDALWLAEGDVGSVSGGECGVSWHDLGTFLKGSQPKGPHDSGQLEFLELLRR